MQSFLYAVFYDVSIVAGATDRKLEGQLNILALDLPIPTTSGLKVSWMRFAGSSRLPQSPAIVQFRPE